MRLRDARRHSSWICKKGFVGVDYWDYLSTRGFYFTFPRGGYACKFALDGVKYLRRSHCAFRLMRQVYIMAESRHATYQRQLVNDAGQRVELGLVDEIRNTLGKGFGYRTAPNYGGPAMLTPVKVEKELREVVGEAIVAEYGLEMLEAVKNNWQNSTNVSDTSRIAPAFNKLASSEMKQMDRETVKRGILLRLAELKRLREGKQHLCFDPKTLANENTNRVSASGILPVKAAPGMGRVKGTKDDMHPAAVAVNIRDRISEELPRALPFRPFLKQEVIKVGKDVRGIQNESLANYQILSIADKGKKQRFDRGNAIGLGSDDASFLSIFLVWYEKYHSLCGGLWSEFLDHIEQRGAHESDKQGWEATTGISDGLPILITDVGLKSFETPGDRRLYVRSVADVMNPFIYVNKGGFFAPFRVPSGTRRTSGQNTDRHRLMVHYVVSWVRSHDGKLGGTDGCRWCERMESHPAYGRQISEMDLELRMLAFILGDDFIAISWGQEEDDFFDSLMDAVYGTVTKRTGVRRFFGAAEFLRKRFIRNEDDSITWYRDPERILAKLYHGSMLRSEKHMAEALLAYKYEAGDNSKLIDCLTRMYSRLDIREDLNMESWVDKAPMLRGLNNYLQLSHSDIVSYQKQFSKTAENLRLIRKTRNMS